MKKKTKIICSIGPATISTVVLEKLVKEGMNVARINFSHASMEERTEVVTKIETVRKTTNKHIGLLCDTKGPELRCGNMANDSIKLEVGKNIKIVKEDVLGTTKSFSINHKEVIDILEVGDMILLENALMSMKVVEKKEDYVTCSIISGGVLGSKKSMSIPGKHLNIDYLSKEDIEDIKYASSIKADFLALSFVSCKEDIIEVKKLLEIDGNTDIKIIAKIENMSGIKNIDGILAESSGIMVARGDLGVEVPLEKLPIYQKELIKKCRNVGKICIVATEMLASMQTEPRPTRAEVSDIFNAVIEGADAVMLSGETTIGKYPVNAVKYMSKVCKQAERSYHSYKTKNNDQVNFTDVIAKSVVDASDSLEINAIVAATMTGYTARKISNLKPKSIIIAICTKESVARSLSLNWGVYPIVIPEYKSTDEVVDKAKAVAIELLNLKKEDNIIITGGFPAGKTRNTNFMKIEKI